MTNLTTHSFVFIIIYHSTATGTVTRMIEFMISYIPNDVACRLACLKLTITYGLSNSVNVSCTALIPI